MNKSRMFFVAICFGVTLSIYFLYAAVLVPSILPAREKAAVIDIPTAPPKDRELLEILFPSDSWVFDEKTNMLSFSEKAGMVFFQNPLILDNSQVQVSPCIVLFFPSHGDEMTPQGKREKYRQAVVLEAENYALLELDGAFGVSSTPQLKSGQLNGIVTVRSQMKKANDPSDDIELKTSDVVFNFTQIQTQQRVDFKFGPNYGHGRKLTIQMANTDESKKGQAPNTVQRIELRELDNLHLYMKNDDLSYSSVRWDTPHLSPYHVAAYPQLIPEVASSGSTFQLRPESVSSPQLDIRNGQTPGTTSQQTLPQQTMSPQKTASTAGMSEVLILCKGIVDLVADTDKQGQWLLTFRDRVDVIRTNPQGRAADQLNCQELSLTFGPKNDGLSLAGATTSAPETNPQTNENPLANFGSLSPLRVKATGTPVTARSPENKGFQAIGREMVLDLVGKVLSLTPGDDTNATKVDNVSILYDQIRVNGKAIYYAFDDENGPGKLDMPGAGTLEGTMGTDTNKRFKLQWHDELKILPADKNSPGLTFVQIRGKPSIELDGIGTASGDEILLWCDTGKQKSATNSPQTASAGQNSTLASTGGKWNVDLKKILMRKNVVLKTDTGEIITSALEIDFQPHTVTTMTSPTTAMLAQSAQVTRFVSRYPGPQTSGTASTDATKNSLSKLSIFGGGDSKSTYTVRADEVVVHAPMVGRETVVEQILLKKNVTLDEKISDTDTEPIHISGHTVHIRNPDSPQLTINIFGDKNLPGDYAFFKGRGAVLMGTNINIDRARNLFWVDGQGELRIAQQAANSTAGKSGGSFGKLFSSSNTGSTNQTIVIDWAGSMEFNGQELLFLKDVDVYYPTMAINKSELVKVQLNKPFLFFDKNTANDIEPERVEIRGNIDLERDAFDEKTGIQLSHDCIRLKAIEIFPKSGVFKGYGPGYVSSIFQYDGNGANSLLSGGTTSSTAPNTGTGLFGKGLKYMQCNFNGSVEGNYETGQIAFHDRVVTMICPARSFRDVINTSNTRNIVANGMLLECNKLEINQFQQGGSGAKSVDLKAEGNTLIEMTYETRYYIANADKIKFEQAKNLITLEGNRNSDVVIYEAANLNAPTQKGPSGKMIKFNPVTKEVSGDGFSGNFLMP